VSRLQNYAPIYLSFISSQPWWLVFDASSTERTSSLHPDILAVQKVVILSYIHWVGCLFVSLPETRVQDFQVPKHVTLGSHLISDAFSDCVKKKINLHVWLIERWSARPEYQTKITGENSDNFPPEVLRCASQFDSFLFLLLFGLDSQILRWAQNYLKNNDRGKGQTWVVKGRNSKFLSKFCPSSLLTFFICWAGGAIHL